MNMIEYLRYRGINMYTIGDGVREKHIRGNGWYHGVCPFCGSKRGGNDLWLGYNSYRDYFYCWNCHITKKWELFKKWFPGENIKAILSAIDTVIDPQKWGAEGFQKENNFYIPPLTPTPLMDSPKHVEYIKSRGLDPEELVGRWGVQSIAYKAEEYFYRNRIFIPVFDCNDNPVSWLTRAVDGNNDVRRYLTAPKDRELEPIKNHLFGEHLVVHSDTIIVVEGSFDAFKVGRNVVATLGKTVTETQKELLRKYYKRIICFDNEDKAQQEAIQLMNDLDIYGGVTVNVCLDAPDPGSASDKEIRELLEYADNL